MSFASGARGAQQVFHSVFREWDLNGDVSTG